MTIFLTAVNDTLTRVGVIGGDTGPLVQGTTDAFQSQSSIQHQVDTVVMLWREAIDELYDHGLFAKEGATGRITLVAGQHEYALASDFQAMTEPAHLRGATSGFVLEEYPGGYAQLLEDQPDNTRWIGQPQAWAISPIDGTIRFDAEPGSGENGAIYYYLYEKNQQFTELSELPFSEETYISMLPYVAQWYERAMKQDFDSVQFSAGFERAVRSVRGLPLNTRYGVR
jgi:hypothetical protein